MGFREWFTDDRRQKIQIFVGSAVPILVLAGLTTQTEADQWLIIVGAALQFFAAVVSIANVRGVASVWKILRGAIYAMAATVAPALTVLGFIDEARGATIMTAVSLGLTTLSSLIAVFTNGEQQLENTNTVADERAIVAFKEGVKRGRRDHEVRGNS